MLIQMQEMLHKINDDRKEIVFLRVPGHVDIRVNEAAGRAAEEVFDKDSTDDLVPFSDLKSLTAKCTHKLWKRKGKGRHIIK